MGLWRRRKADKDNGHHVDEPSAITRIEPRMATDLGDALTAYWRSGQWWGSDHLIRWLIDHGHMSEAAYALGEVMHGPHIPEGTRRQLRRYEGRLKTLTTDQIRENRSDAPEN